MAMTCQVSRMTKTRWTFRIFFIFFLLGEGKGESEAPGRGGTIFYWKSQEGGVSRASGGGAEGREGASLFARNFGGGG